MKYLNSLLYIFLSVSTSVAQNAGSGRLEWWSSTCDGFICNRQILNERIFWIVIPQDGDLVINGSTTGLTANCNTCNIPSNPIASSIFKSNGLGLGSFASSSTITVSCLEAGDSIGVRFFTIGSGFYGNYEFSSTLLVNPHGNDVEPNDTKETATLHPINSSTIEGHIYYGSIDRDSRDYFEIGTFAVGDSIHWNIVGDAGYFSIQRLGAANITNIGDLVNGPGPLSGHHIIAADDTYYLVVTSIGSAPCGYYDITLTGDRGHREYVLTTESIEINHDPLENIVYVSGDFTNKFIEITNVSNTVVADLSGMNSPIIYDVNTLPAGKHFLVIRDDNYSPLEVHDLIKE